MIFNARNKGLLLVVLVTFAKILFALFHPACQKMVSGFHRGGYEEYHLLGYDAM
jgi:hypothetical protein